VPGATSVEIFPADGRIIVHRAGKDGLPEDFENEWDAATAKLQASK
jgi:hypothetical protein